VAQFNKINSYKMLNFYKVGNSGVSIAFEAAAEDGKTETIEVAIRAIFVNGSGWQSTNP
jgi:hypothetical protein